MSHTAPTASTTTATEPRPIDPATLARWAGGLAIGHVVVMLAAFSQEGVMVDPGSSPKEVAKVFGALDLTRTLGAGYVEALAFVVLAAAIVLIARVLGRRTEVGRLATQTLLILGAAMIGSTIAAGFPAGAAAAYGSQHGADSAVTAMVNDIRNYAFVLQVAFMAAMTLALGIAALAERMMVKWVGYGGVGVGGLGLALTPFGHNLVSLVWMVWWVGLGVLLLRTQRRA